jgi:hypothetical protein
LRLVTEAKAHKNHHLMSVQVFNLRGAVEQDRVPEARLMSDFEELCGKAKGCMNFLKFELPEDCQNRLEHLWSEVECDTTTTAKLPFIDFALARRLVEFILQQVESEFMCSVSHWSRVLDSPECKASSIVAYRKVEKAMEAIIKQLTSSEKDPGAQPKSKNQQAKYGVRGRFFPQ